MNTFLWSVGLGTWVAAVAVMALQDQPRELNCKPVADQAEAVEWLVKGVRDGDILLWDVRRPAENDFLVFENGNSYIVDPAPDFTGKLEVECVVINHSEGYAQRLKAFTVIGGDPVAEIPSGAVSFDEKKSALRLLSADQSPAYSGEVLGLWRQASGRAEQGEAINEVTKWVVDELNQLQLGGTWGSHYRAVSEYLSEAGKGDSPNWPALLSDIADGIEDRK